MVFLMIRWMNPQAVLFDKSFTAVAQSQETVSGIRAHIGWGMSGGTALQRTISSRKTHCLEKWQKRSTFENGKIKLRFGIIEDGPEKPKKRFRQCSRTCRTDLGSLMRAHICNKSSVSSRGLTGKGNASANGLSLGFPTGLMADKDRSCRV